MPAMSKLDPPFRADHVGSLLRPPEVRAARRARAAGDDRRRRAARRRGRGDRRRRDASWSRSAWKAITDGEFRRAWFHLDFLQQLSGVAVTGQHRGELRRRRHGAHDAAASCPSSGRCATRRDIQVADFEYLASVVTETPKVSIPSPTMVHFRGGRAAIDIDAYPDLEVFFADLAACYRAEIAALYAAGCRYLQLDDTNLAYLCDPVMRQGAVERGDDPDELPHAYAELINAALAERPDDLTVAVHLCRGNYRSTWFAQGGYEPVAEVLFTELDVDAYFLEYDDERSGDFAPAALRPRRQDRRARSGHQQAARRSSPTTSSPPGSTRPPRTCRSTGCASARSAASPARSRATR